MSYSEEDLIMISALAHFSYCERRCALIHIEQMWNENLFTAEGRIMHERVHEENRESRGNLRVECGVPLRSLRLGLIGKADIIEFHRLEDDTWQPFPVEYKRGKPKADDCDKVQLCAQALCLEEMLNTHISKGALFYGKTRRRLDISFDEKLRQKTEEASRNVRALIESGRTPSPVYTKKCESCSLVAECLPKTMGKKRSVKSYLTRILSES
uniref:CRISPR-associated exonuclease Cas4 n=1 Tax=Candidatus Desulfatibia profunda TaxID=2841695 RepID=A0A8J6TNW5_9BACT|nr:CRISPR-associated protein Cas4 [Candidatus Desulfatibia profunda]